MTDDPTKLTALARDAAMRKYINNGHFTPTAGMLAGFDAGFYAAKAFYQREWIPVSKGLPEKSGNYFVTYCVPISKREDVTSLYWNGSEWVFLRNWRGKVVLSILAWKPMPQSFREPYKEPTP